MSKNRLSAYCVLGLMMGGLQDSSKGTLVSTRNNRDHFNLQTSLRQYAFLGQFNTRYVRREGRTGGFLAYKHFFDGRKDIKISRRGKPAFLAFWL